MLQKATIHFLFSLGIRSGRRPKAPVERSFTHQTAQSSFRCGNSSKIRRLNVSKESCTPWLFLFENPSPLNFPASNLVGSITAHSSLWFPLYFLFLILSSLFLSPFVGRSHTGSAVLLIAPFPRFNSNAGDIDVGHARLSSHLVQSNFSVLSLLSSKRTRFSIR